MAEFYFEDGFCVRDGRRIPLAPLEVAALTELARNRGEYVSRKQLKEALWGEHEVGDSALRGVIRNLRQKIDLGYQEQLIETLKVRWQSEGGWRLKA